MQLPTQAVCCLPRRQGASLQTIEDASFTQIRLFDVELQARQLFWMAFLKARPFALNRITITGGGKLNHEVARGSLCDRSLCLWCWLRLRCFRGGCGFLGRTLDRKSTRLNSSHVAIS